MTTLEAAAGGGLGGLLRAGVAFCGRAQLAMVAPVDGCGQRTSGWYGGLSIPGGAV